MPISSSPEHDAWAGRGGCVGCLAITVLLVVLIVIGVPGGEDSTPPETAEKNESRKEVDEPGGAKKEPLDEQNEPKPVPSPPVDPDLAEIYVYGNEMEAGRGDYWVEWSDDTGAVQSDRKRGILPIEEDTRRYTADISAAPTDGLNRLEVTAYKRTDWEGDLQVLLKVGGEWRDCSGTDSP